MRDWFAFSQEFSDFVTTEKTLHGEITLFWRWDDVNTALKRGAGMPGTAWDRLGFGSGGYFTCRVSTEITSGFSFSKNNTRLL